MTAMISQDHGALCIDTGGRKYFRRAKGRVAGDRGVVHRDDAKRVVGLAAGRAYGTARRRYDLVGDAGRDLSFSLRDGVSGDERRTERGDGGQEEGAGVGCSRRMICARFPIHDRGTEIRPDDPPSRTTRVRLSNPTTCISTDFIRDILRHKVYIPLERYINTENVFLEVVK